jgi:tetratricopeptide (TPR) repeat protein
VDLSRFARIKWEKALDLKKRGAYYEAEKELKEALDENPDHPLLNASLAQLYLKLDRSTEAKLLAERTLTITPHYPPALTIVGELHYKEGRFKEALMSFRQAHEMDPRPYLTLRIAATLRTMGRYEEALKILDSELVSKRGNPRLLKEKAIICNRLKRYAEALELYEKAQKLDPNDPFVRSQIYKLRGRDREDAAIIRELKTVVTLPSRRNDPQLHGLLGEKLKKVGKFDEAIAEFREAGHLAPENPYFLKQEGFCHYKKKAYRQAIQTLGEAFQKDPDDYRVRAALEKAYRETHDLEGFVTLLVATLREHPQNVKLNGVLKRIQKETDAANPDQP